MQRGCLKPKTRKRGPEVWQFRWSEIGPDGKRLHHKKVVGTVEQYPHENAARRLINGLVSEINTGARQMNSGAMTVAQLCDHFAQRELAKDNSWRSHATKKVYQAYLTRRIRPHWQKYGLTYRAVESMVERGQKIGLEVPDSRTGIIFSLKRFGYGPQY